MTQRVSTSPAVSVTPRAPADIDLSVTPEQDVPPRPFRLPRDVAEFVRVNKLTEVDGARSTRRAAGIAAVYLSAAYVGWSFNEPWLWALVWALQGMCFLGCVAGQHEAIHGLVYQRRGLNHLAGAVFGAMLLFPYAAYRYGHLEHHRWTNAEGDTQPTPPFRNVIEYVVLTPLSGIVFVAMQWWTALRTLAGRPPVWVRNSRQRAEIQCSTAAMLIALVALAAATMNFSQAALMLYWAPLLAGGCVWLVIVTIPEHYGCAPGPASAFDTTRTTTSNAALRWFFWGSNYHTEHHLHPNVPSPRLNELHEHIADRCQHVETSYLRWHFRLFRELAGRSKDAGS